MHKPSPAVLTLLLCGVFAAGGAAQSERRPMTIVDLLDMPQIGEPRLSPDASRLLYVRREADWKKNGTTVHIWRVNVDGSGTVQMTSGQEGESSPRWSPDGAVIAFVAQRGDDKHAQIYTMPDNGGEARRLTEHATAVSSPQWSPDGKWIYFVAAEDKTAEEKAREKVKDNVFAFEENGKNRHVWRASVATGKAERITGGEFSINGYELSRDGTMIAHSRTPTPLLDDFLHGEVWVMRADGSESKQITTNAVGEYGASLSPDNQHVLFVANTDDQLKDLYYNNRLFVAPVAGGPPRSLVPGGDYDISDADWSKSGEEIYFSANTGVRQHLYRVSAGGGEVAAVTRGDHAVRSWHFVPASGVVAFSWSDPKDPGELRLLDVSTPAVEAESRRVTQVYADVLERFDVPRVEVVRWKGADGVDVEGLLYYPLDYREGTRSPLVVQTHGGPAASDKIDFGNSHDYEPVLTALGYFVFKPNYRGSTGYGDAFLRDMVGHYFHQAHVDVMRGVDALIDRGLVDGDRMAKMGWSAGGHMTNKIITYTDRFKAASSGAGAINWVSMYGQSDVRTYRTPWFGGTPWDEGAPATQYFADSPLFDLHKVKTPTIVLVGENDMRVPMAQSIELYRALKHLGVPTHLYVAPKQGHGWRELQQRLFKANVELAWFEKWVRGREYEWVKSPEHPVAEKAVEASADGGK